MDIKPSHTTLPTQTMAPVNQLLLAAAVCGAALATTAAEVYHASPSDGAAGLCKCLQAAVLPGDECRLHAGGSAAAADRAALLLLARPTACPHRAPPSALLVPRCRCLRSCPGQSLSPGMV